MQRILRHSIFWIAYLLLQSYIEFAWISHSFASMVPWERFLMAFNEEAIQLIIKIPLVYLSFYIINQYAISNKHYIKAVIFLLAILTLSIIAHRYLVVKILLPYIYKEVKTEEPFLITRIISSFIDLVFLIGIANAIKQFSYQLELRDREKNLIKEKLEAELHLLKAQTNPHFLFNTLNNIYALARKNSSQTADVVMKLSKLLRFMLYESSKNRIPLAQEIKLIQDYVELEKIRYSDRLTVDFTIDVENELSEITPLILLPLIENAFKHGASESRFDSFIKISLIVKNEQLLFTVENSKDPTGETDLKENIGLKNLKRQLELLYSRYNLELQNEESVFKVELMIDLDSKIVL